MPKDDPSAAGRQLNLDENIAERIDFARQIIFAARSIAAVAAAAAISELPDHVSAQYALHHAATILNDAAEMLDLANLRRP
jgi:hypothetical protein